MASLHTGPMARSHTSSLCSGPHLLWRPPSVFLVQNHILHTRTACTHSLLKKHRQQGATPGRALRSPGPPTATAEPRPASTFSVA